jgi:hypothetical protein
MKATDTLTSRAVGTPNNKFSGAAYVSSLFLSLYNGGKEKDVVVVELKECNL